MNPVLKATVIGLTFLSLIVSSSAQVDSAFRLRTFIDLQIKDCEVSYPINDHGLNYTTDFNYYWGDNIPNSGHGLVFNCPVQLTKDTFLERLDIRKAKFAEDALFDSVLFSRNTDFTYSVFKANARFEYCGFSDSAHFCMCTFLGDADFSNVVFGNVAYFSGLIFGPQSNLSFTLATLPTTLDLSENIRIPQVIELTDAQFIKGKVYRIFLNRTNISMVHLDYQHFKLLFIDPKTGDTLSDEEKSSIYEQLLQNFKSHGQEDSYQALDIEYHHFQANSPLNWLADKLQMLWWNYGYSKWRVIAWAIVFVLLFSALNYFWLNHLNEKVYPIDGIPAFSKLGENPFSWRRACRRFWYSTVYTSTVFFRLSIEVKKIQFNRVLASLYIFMIYLLGILCLAYTANFVLQK